MVSLEVLVKKVEDLPPLPQTVLMVLRLTEDPEATVESVSRVITQDENFTARVLRLANSAYYALPRRVSSVTEAVLLLGFKTIRSLVLTISLTPLLWQELKGYALSRGALWRHAITCAFAARLLAAEARYPDKEEAFVAGILHDIGKLILSYYLTANYAQVLEAVKKGGRPFPEVELEVLGFQHDEVGGMVAEKWNLPVPLTTAIRYHHRPAEAKEAQVLTALVHLADALTLMLGVGLGVDGLSYPFEEECLSLLKLSSLQFEEVMAQLANYLARGDLFRES